MKTIDLGTKTPGMGSFASAEVSVPETNEPKVNYPSIYLSDRAAEDMDGIPDEGMALVKYKVRERTERTRDGKETCTLDIDIMDFTPKGKGKKSSISSEESADDDIEKGLSKAEKETSKDED